MAAPAAAPDGLFLDGRVYAFQATRGLAGPVQLTLPVTARPNSAAPAEPNAALLAYFDTQSRHWVPVPARYDPASHTISGTTTHLSVWAVLMFDPTKGVDLLHRELAKLLLLDPVAAQPTCAGSAALAQQQVSVTSASGNLVRWCAGTSADGGGTTLRIANNRHSAVQVNYPQTWSVRRLTPMDTLTDKVVAQVSRSLTTSFKGESVVIIPGGASIELDTSTASPAGTVRITPNPGAYLVTALLYGLDTLAMTLAKVPGAKPISLSQTERVLDAAFNARGCITGMDDVVHSSTGTVLEAGSTWRTALTVAFGCLGPVWKLIGTGPGGVVAFIGQVGLWMLDGVQLAEQGLQGAIDSLVYWRTYWIQVAPTPLLGVVPANFPDARGYGTAHPTVIDNGGLDATGVVNYVHWLTYGGPQAIGTGMSVYVPDGRSTAEGTYEQVRIVAFNLGVCNGRYVYRAVEWFFPQHGQIFNPSVYMNACTDIGHDPAFPYPGS